MKDQMITDNEISIMTPEFKPLQAATIPLTGSHLIEASAGTGKTFNITRIYLRLLLERKLSVENILVMTFTKAATEEIRGRIDGFLREAFNHWDEWSEDKGNELFYRLGQQIPAHQAKLILKLALLQLDDAAIFTIHGFCKRVLSQYAFSSGVSFNAAMETDDQEYYLQSIQDLYRRLSASGKEQEKFLTISQFWPSPEEFYQTFISVCRLDTEVNIQTPEDKLVALQGVIEQAIKSLNDNEPLIAQHLIDSKTGKARAQRQEEYSLLRQQLQQAKQLAESIDSVNGIDIDFRFCSGTRLPKGKDKAEQKLALQQAFLPVNDIKSGLSKLPEQLLKMEAFSYVAEHLQEIRCDVSRLKQEQQILSFDDLINTLESALTSGTHRQELIAQLRQQYPAALVDEFQDTDPGQFNILSTLYFGSSPEGINLSEHQSPQATSLYLIGDPKQAIYGFRGGDIFTYLKAGQQVNHRWIMDTNWRSSAAMIHAYNVFFYGNELHAKAKDIFGYSINYQPVLPSVNASSQQLMINGDPTQALQCVHFQHNDEDISQGKLSKDYCAKIAAWLANQVTELLTNGAIIKNGCVNQQSQNMCQPVQAGDIAVLVRDGGQAAYVLQALKENGLSAVYKSERSNLLQHPLSAALVDVLRTIISPDDERRLYGTLAGPYFGFSPEQLSDLQEDERRWEALVQELQELHQIWQKRGFMPMAMKLLHDYFPSTFASEYYGSRERMLTNSIHLFELLQGLSQQHRSPLQLISQFEYLCQNPQMVETELRLESDADLIQVVTQHGSKGLEYPIVFVPFACMHRDPLKIGNRNREVITAHDDQGNLKVALGEDVTLGQAMADEQYAEDIRLLYVALTRAKLQCYLFSADFKGSDKSPLGNALQLASAGDYPSAWQVYVDNANRVRHKAGGPVAIDNIANYQLVDTSFLSNEAYQRQDSEPQLSVASFLGRIERDWWLTSFSGLTRGHRHYGLSDPDRLDANAANLVNIEPGIAHQIAKGAKTGNLLHDILETIDFTEPDWSWVITRLIQSNLAGDESQASEICQWLDNCLSHPLMLSDDHACSMGDLQSEQVLKELEFYFPVKHLHSRRLNEFISEFRNEAMPELAQYAQLPTKGDIQGMMHGFIDLVFEHNGKYYVCDYKSSFLGDSVEDYRADKLQQHMFDNFYDLQALIYSLALHRYLKTRLSDYSVERHFGGAVYLYLRGMGQLDPEVIKGELRDKQYGVYVNGLSRYWLEKFDNLVAGDISQVEELS